MASNPSGVRIYGGRLAETSLFDVVAAIALSRTSGTLTVSRGPAQKDLSISDGAIVGSRSNQRDDHLGKLLHRWGTISTESYRRLQLKEGVDSKLRFGEHLIAMSAIDHHTLTGALRQQVLWRVGEVFSWRDGTYLFTPGEVADHVLPVTLTEVFSTAIRRALGGDYLRVAARSLLDTVPQHFEGSPYELLILNEAPLIDLLNRVTGRIAFRGLVGAHLPAHFWEYVFVLRELGCIEFVVPPEIEALRRAEIRSTATDDESTLDLGADDSPTARIQKALEAFRAGRKLLNARRWEQAEKEFLRAVDLVPHGAEFLGHLAWVRVLQNPHDMDVISYGQAMLRKASRTLPGSIDLAFFHASVCWLAGHPSSAKAEYERILCLNPMHKEAGLALKKLAGLVNHEAPPGSDPAAGALSTPVSAEG